MIHFRRIIFDLLDLGKSNTEIQEIVRVNHHMEISGPRIENYRTLHTRFDEIERQKFMDGKLDLLGNPP